MKCSTGRDRSILLVGPLLAMAACGGATSEGARRPERMDVHGVLVELETDAPFAKAADFPARLESTVDAALQYWGGSWSQVEGRTLVLVDAPAVECNGGTALGCYDGALRLTTRDPGTGTVRCIEETVLVHEIGHAVLGDPDHTDPRWMEMDDLVRTLAGRPGYTATGEAPCTTYASVWQHPLGSP